MLRQPIANYLTMSAGETTVDPKLIPGYPAPVKTECHPKPIAVIGMVHPHVESAKRLIVPNHFERACACVSRGFGPQHRDDRLLTSLEIGLKRVINADPGLLNHNTPRVN